MKIFNSDSSKEAKYLEAVERKERAKDILWKHIGPYGIGMTSKFAQASLRAMDEYHTEQLHKLSVSGSCDHKEVISVRHAYKCSKCGELLV